MPTENPGPVLKCNDCMSTPSLMVMSLCTCKRCRKTEYATGLYSYCTCCARELSVCPGCGRKVVPALPGDRYAELDPSATLDETSPVSTSAAPEDMPPLPAGTRCAPLENP